MLFNFNLFNHTSAGQRTLEDVVMILAHQLKALGHRVGRDDANFIPGSAGINVVVECFDARSIDVLKNGRDKGLRFLIVATEEPTDKGFNHGLDRSMVDRQAAFPDAARHAEAILALVPGTEAWYGRHAPAARAELGHAPSLERRVRFEPDHDFGFYGAMSGRRFKMLKRLGRKMGTPNAVRIVANFAEQAHRDEEMMRARVIVQVRYHDRMGLVSSSRCNTALHIGRPVVAEPHALSSPWDQVVKFSADSDKFFDDCVKCRAIWRQAHAEQMERFRRLMSPQACVGDALVRVGLDRAMAAA